MPTAAQGRLPAHLFNPNPAREFDTALTHRGRESRVVSTGIAQHGEGDPRQVLLVRLAQPDRLIVLVPGRVRRRRRRGSTDATSTRNPGCCRFLGRCCRAGQMRQERILSAAPKTSVFPSINSLVSSTISP
jgi:hypothetical protein